MDPGDQPTPAVVKFVRAETFTDVVSFTVTGGVGEAPASQPPPTSGSTSTFAFSVTSSSTARGDFTYVVTGSGGGFTVQTNVVLHIGSLLGTSTDASTVTVPPLATAVVVKAWGAGGGSACMSPGAGGAGGFATARFEAPEGTVLSLVAGTTGTCISVNGASNGAGGGFSGVKGSDQSYWLIAGGGGGAGFTLGTGGGGGGAAGEPGSSCGGMGGTQSGGGLGSTCSDAGGNAGEAGSAYQGGSGAGAGTGGVPGGGNAGVDMVPGAGGGGGGGYFGGAAGGFHGAFNFGGGGGGSGFVRDGGADATLSTATGTTPPMMTDPDYVSGVASPDHSGLVVVRLAKP